MVSVSNQTLWLLHDLDDESHDYKKVEKEFDLWNKLYEELQTEIILRLKQENETKGTHRILSGVLKL